MRSFDTLDTGTKSFLNSSLLLFFIVSMTALVSEKKAKDWCASKGNIPYFETSAKEDYNVDPAFLSIAKIALANEHGQDIYFQGIPEADSESEQRGGCAC
uniref:Uncharacterized protein n=1 Tax=Salix viminalis TaxID=40686 RepID=A0A6N2N8T8_SALVM